MGDRKEAARKANATRKANKEAELRRLEAERIAISEVWDGMSEQEQDAISNELCVWNVLDDEYEQMLDSFAAEKEEEMKDALRTLLRKGTMVKAIQAAMQEGYATTTFDFGVYSITLDADKLLDDILCEDEFLGGNQPTPELKQKMWEQTDRIHVSLEEAVAV